MSVQDEIRRITAPDIFARKGGGADRVPHLLSRAYRAAGRQILRRDPGRRLARHGDARAGDHRPGHARNDDPARPRGDARLQARAGGRRHAVWLLRGLEGTGLHERRARAEGNRLRRHQGRRRRAHGGDHRLPGRARRAGDGACRLDAAGDQRARLVPRAGARGGRLGAHRAGHAGRGARPAPSRW